MKHRITFTLIGLLCGCCLSASGQQIVTLTQMGPGTNAISIEADQSVTIHNVYGHQGSYLVVNKNGVLQRFYADDFVPESSAAPSYAPRRYPTTVVFSGPTVVEAVVPSASEPTYTIMASIEISPSQYPPGKSAVIGERDGPMKCTLEESTDLVNWTQSTSGQTHSLTNANAKKFFRIKLEQDVGP